MTWIHGPLRLLAQASGDEGSTGESPASWFSRLGPEQLGILVAIVAVVVGGAVAITKLVLRHRERLAMIERGIHPDSPAGRDAPE